MLPTLPEVPGWTGFLALCAGPAPWTPAGAGDVPALAPVTTRARAHAPPPVRACHHTVSPPSGNKSSENPWRYICTALLMLPAGQGSEQSGPVKPGEHSQEPVR